MRPRPCLAVYFSTTSRCLVPAAPGPVLAQSAPLVHAQRLVMLDRRAHLPLCLHVHRTMGRMRKGSIGMPKAKKKKVMHFEEPQEVELVCPDAGTLAL